MSNPYYGHGDGVPVYLSRGNSSTMQAEFDLIAAGFDGAYAAILLRGLIAGQAWTGTHNFTGATLTVPTLTYGTTGNGAVSVDLLNAAVFSAAGGNLPAQAGKVGYALITDGGTPGTLSWSPVYPVIKVSEHVASGSDGQAITTGSLAFVRTLNTTDINTITGASLSSNTVTLPAGTYDVYCRVPISQFSSTQLLLYNSSDSTNILVGGSHRGASVALQNLDNILTGRFTLAATKNVQVRHYVLAGSPAKPATSTLGEVYTEATFFKVS